MAFQYLMSQMHTHKLTQRILSKAPNEIEHVASCYATYLRSTRILSELQQRYASQELNAEQSANLVGLTIPKK